MEAEVWKYVPGYEGKYMVSNMGRVKTVGRVLKRRDGKTLSIKSRIRTLTKYEKSPNRFYYKVALKDLGKKQRVITVHTLVAMAFLGFVPNGKLDIVVDHKNNNSLDNRLENLQLITIRENSTKDRNKALRGVTGAYLDKKRSKWTSVIQINGTSIFLGRYETEEVAALAYKTALLNIKSYDNNRANFRKIVNNLIKK